MIFTANGMWNCIIESFWMEVWNYSIDWHWKQQQSSDRLWKNILIENLNPMRIFDAFIKFLIAITNQMNVHQLQKCERAKYIYNYCII